MSTVNRVGLMPRRLDRPADTTFIRLEIGRGEMPAVEEAAHACRLSLASYCRLVIEMVSAGKAVRIEDVRREADRRLRPADEKQKGRKEDE